MRVKLLIEYDGTNYCGWQVQKNGNTVQEEIEKALFSLLGEKIKVVGSGRTDAGVHAKGQVAHFDFKKDFPPERFCRALNTFLPKDIRILKSERVKDDFDARKSAKKKTYRYSFYVSEEKRPLKERYAENLKTEPDISLIKKAAKIIEGEHDFKAFCASNSGAKTTIRTVYSVSVDKTDNDIFVTVTGNGFLYNMVRIICGTLIAVGYKKIEEKDVKTMLETGKKAKNVKTLKAKGLCLESVYYF